MNTSKALINIALGTLVFNPTDYFLISGMIAFFLLNESFLFLYKNENQEQRKRQIALFYWSTYIFLIFSIAKCFVAFQALLVEPLEVMVEIISAIFNVLVIGFIWKYCQSKKLAKSILNWGILLGVLIGNLILKIVHLVIPNTFFFCQKEGLQISISGNHELLFLLILLILPGFFIYTLVTLKKELKTV